MAETQIRLLMLPVSFIFRIKTDYCINTGATSNKQPCFSGQKSINTAIHVLLIHSFATLFTPVPSCHTKHVLSLQINMTNHENLPRPESSIFIKT